MNENLKLHNVCFYGFLLIVSWIGSLKTQDIEETPIAKGNITEIKDEKLHSEKSWDNSNVEIKDVYDDYMQIVIYEDLQFRTAIQHEDKVWENGIVPYEISDEYSKENKDFILESMEEFHNKTCVRFQQKKNESSYIMLVPGTGCSAVIGKIPNKTNTVNLHENCFVKGIVLHELMHALGFIHEQNRPDRDNFVKINFDNIKNGTERNFEKYSDGDLHLFNQTYDYGSVMHYGAKDFAMNRNKSTIIPVKKGVEIGQRKGFSEKDLIKINLLYNCTGVGNSAISTEAKKATTKEDKGGKDIASEFIDETTQVPRKNKKGILRLGILRFILSFL